MTILIDLNYKRVHQVPTANVREDCNEDVLVRDRKEKAHYSKHYLLALANHFQLNGTPLLSSDWLVTFRRERITGTDQFPILRSEMPSVPLKRSSGTHG